MRAMTLEELQDRYSMSKEEFLKFHRDHIQELPANSKKGKQTIVYPPSAIDVFDILLDYEEKEEPITVPGLAEDEKKIYLEQIEKLKQALQEAEEKNSELKKEKDDYSERFIALQNGRDLNTSLIQKLQQEKDVLSMKLSNLTKFKEEELAIKENRIKEMENQLIKMQDFMSENSELNQEIAENRVKIMNLKKSEQAHYADLSRCNSEIKTLESKNIALKENVVLAENEVLSCKKDMQLAIDGLVQIVASLKLSVRDEKNTITTSSDETIINEPLEKEESAMIPVSDSEDAVVSEVLDDTRKESEEGDALPPFEY